MNQKYLSTLEAPRVHSPSNWIFQFVYLAPPYRLEKNISKHIKEDLIVLRSNRGTVGYLFSDVPGSQTIDVIIVCYYPRMTINGGVPYPYLDLPQVMISDELRKVVLPHCITDSAFVQIFDASLKETILERVPALGYTEITRYVSTKDFTTYKELWAVPDN